MARTQTSAENLRDLIRLLGGEPSGSTIAELLDELEHVVPTDAPSQDTMRDAMRDAIAEWVEEHAGELTDADMDYVFSDED